MKTFSKPLLACGLLWLAGITGCTPPAATHVSGSATPAGTQLLAQSAQLIVLAHVDSDWLTLRIQRTSDQTPLVSKDVAVSVAGHAIPVKAKPDGTYVLPVKQLGTTYTPTLDIVVGHDGIREILTGKLTLPQSAPATAGRGHSQMFWWIANIAVVFAVAMYFSSRKKKPEPAE